VQYLNARPLIHGYDGDVVFDHPAELARQLAAGDLDCALVPAFEVLRDPCYDLVDGVAVASDGPVHSVVLAYRGALQEIRSVVLDPASMSSTHLLQVLLAEFHRIHPHYGTTGDARLLIGNHAIAFRARENGRDPDWHWLDLGDEWQRRTGHPFVYAIWALRPGIAHAADVADALRRLKRHGAASIETIIAEDRDASAVSDAAFRRRYLTQHIRYDLAEREKQGLARYRELLTKWRLIAADPRPLRLI
jgi:chorismate dehydratase